MKIHIKPKSKTFKCCVVLLCLCCAGHVGAQTADPVVPTDGDVPGLLQPDGWQVVPGQCWVQAVIPARKVSESQVLLLQEGWTAHGVRHAVLGQESVALTVKEGAVRYRVTEPRYEKITETILVKDAYKKITVQPAVHEEVLEDVLVEAQRVELQACTAGSRQTGAVQCAVTVPAKYKKVKRLVLVAPEMVREETIPAVYDTVVKWVLVEESRVIPVDVPPEQVRLAITRVQVPETVVEQKIPPRYGRVEVVNYHGAPQLTWRRVVCQNELNPQLIARLQQALARQALLAAHAVDGRWGKRTQQALKRYQQQNGLAVGHVTHETLAHLKVAVGG